MLTKIDLMDKGTDAVDVSSHPVSSILNESTKVFGDSSFL